MTVNNKLIKILPAEFYRQDTIKTAKELLGCTLVHETERGVLAGKIVETEAYLHDDPGSHSYKGATKRNATMFGPAGLAYVYLIYGIYYCFNVVTNKEGVGEAVLIRALEPLKGVELMKAQRKKEKIKELCSGPGKLTEAMGINMSHNGADLTSSNLYIKDKEAREKIHSTTRIGINVGADLPYRFYIKDNMFISKK